MKHKGGISPTSRTLALLRERGYTVNVVEHYNARIKRKFDLYGFIDIVGVRPGEQGVIGVQTTSGGHIRERIAKAEAIPAYHTWLAAGNVVEFHGWRKIKSAAKVASWQPIIERRDVLSPL